MIHSRSSLEPVLLEQDFIQRIARKETVDQSAADDLVQELYLRAMRRPPELPAGPQLRAWLRTVAQRIVLDRVRQDSRRKYREWGTADLAAQHSDCPRVHAEQRDRGRQVRQAVKELRQPYRTVLELHYLQEHSAEAIAVQMGCKPSAIRQQIRRGLVLLRENLSRTDGRPALEQQSGSRWFAFLPMPKWLLDRRRRLPAESQLAMMGGALIAPLAAYVLFSVENVDPLTSLSDSLRITAAPPVQRRPAIGKATRRLGFESVDSESNSATPWVPPQQGPPLDLQPKSPKGNDESGLKYFQPSDFEAGGGLDVNSHFGRSLRVVGDLNGDGNVEICIGADGDQAVGAEHGVTPGSIWFFSIDADGQPINQKKITQGVAGFEGRFLVGTELFGRSVASAGDLDRDGRNEVVVGAPWHETEASALHEGGVWILFLDSKLNVQREVALTGVDPQLEAIRGESDEFGYSVCSLGDLDGNGVPDLGVGAPSHGDSRGMVWILFLAEDGACLRAKKIDTTTYPEQLQLQVGDRFGIHVDGPGDLDGDGVPDLQVVARYDDQVAVNAGAAWQLLLRPDGSVRAFHKVLPNILPLVNWDWTDAELCQMVLLDRLSPRGMRMALFSFGRRGSFYLELDAKGRPCATSSTNAIGGPQLVLPATSEAGRLDLLVSRTQFDEGRGGVFRTSFTPRFIPLAGSD